MYLCVHRIGSQLMLVTHNHSRRLRVYTITIEWNAVQQTRPNGQPVYRVAPSLEIAHTSSLDNVSAQLADTARLSHLSIFAPVPEYADTSFRSHLTVLATFTQALPSVDDSHQHPNAFTTIARWHIEDVVPTLHESFGKLKMNMGSAPIMSPIKILERQPDIGTNKLILSIQSMNSDTIIAFVTSDGTIEFRERGSWNIIEAFGDTTFTSSLAQAGFEHLAGEHSTDVAISSDGAAMAFVQSDGKINAKTMALRYTWSPIEDGIIDTQGVLETAVVCIARQHTMMVNGNSSTVEPLALLPANLSPQLQQLLRQEAMRAITRSFDLVGQEENRKQSTVFRDHLIPRALSAQLALGIATAGPTQQPDLQAQLAWAILNLKHVNLAIMSTATRQDTLNPTLLHSVRGLVRWGIDVQVLVIKALLEISNRTSPTKSAAQAAAEYSNEENNPAIYLLLCSYPRTLLRYLGLYLQRYFKILQAVLPRSKSVLEKQQLLEVLKLQETMPFRWDFISASNSILNGVEKAVHEAYATANTQQVARGDMELQMITDCAIPATLHPALENMVGRIFDKHRRDIELSALYFWDTSWLHLHAVGKEPNFDALRKLPLTKNMKLRRCRRCHSSMQDVATSQEETRELPQWLNATQRSCVCTCAWYIPWYSNSWVS